MSRRQDDDQQVEQKQIGDIGMNFPPVPNILLSSNQDDRNMMSSLNS